MAAANTDLLKKYKSLFSTTLSTGIGTGTGDTITPATVTGLPTDTAIILTFDRVDSSGVATPSKLERIIGVVSGGNFTSYVRGKDGTTEQAHSSGAVIEMVWNAQDWNDLIDWGLVEHNQDGTHKAITATSIDIGSTIAVTGVLDEDTMSSNSAVKLATQQSIKAYVGAQTSTASSATPTPTGDKKRNELYITALAAAAELQAPSGTPANGNILMIRIKDDGTARALTYNAIYRAVGITLPTTTTISKTLYIAGQYNSADSKWDMLATGVEA